MKVKTRRQIGWQTRLQTFNATHPTCINSYCVIETKEDWKKAMKSQKIYIHTYKNIHVEHRQRGKYMQRAQRLSSRNKIKRLTTTKKGEKSEIRNIFKEKRIPDRFEQKKKAGWAKHGLLNGVGEAPRTKNGGPPWQPAANNDSAKA